MSRLSHFLLALSALVFAHTAAAQQPQMSGNAAIDAQWSFVGRGAQAPIDPRSAPNQGIFRMMLGPGRAAPAAPQPVAAPWGTPQEAVRPQMDPAFLPAVVSFPTKERPGTIVIDTRRRYLYLVLEGGKAQRYGVGVGRDGFGWSGSVRVGRKAEWPRWTPPAEMRKRQPYLPVSMEGGPSNPLGARALYLHRNGKDTLFRIHGSNEPWTIGQAVSSGCFRMRNEDVIALYERVPIGTKVVVL
jgi:lipoprotein-anchoring transpeptidase ErfK/SrfK